MTNIAHTGPVPVELMDAPRIVLGKREWAVPELAARQNMRLLPLLMLGFKGLSNPHDITEEQTAALFTVGYVALTRAYPTLKRNEYDDMPITLPELMKAVPIIAQQAGMEKGQPSGEVQAEGQTETTAAG